jgi:hypothetical protein
MPDTFGMDGRDYSSQCAKDDKEQFWKFLDQPMGFSARATPYSGPRS